MAKKTAAPFGLRNTVETLMKTVISALAKKSCWPKKTADLMVTRKPSKTIGCSDISAFGAPWGNWWLNGCYIGASSESAGPPWKPLEFLAFPMPSPDVEQCVPEAPSRPARKSDGYWEIVKNHWLQWHSAFPGCLEQDERLRGNIPVCSFVVWAPHNAYGNPSKTIGKHSIS